MSITRSGRPIVRAVDLGINDVAAGAAGYVDTDISAQIPAGAKAIVVICKADAGAGLGAREPGSSATPEIDTGTAPFTSVVGVSPAGHVEFRRDAAVNLHYYVIGAIL